MANEKLDGVLPLAEGGLRGVDVPYPQQLPVAVIYHAHLCFHDAVVDIPGQKV